MFRGSITVGIHDEEPHLPDFGSTDDELIKEVLLLLLFYFF